MTPGKGTQRNFTNRPQWDGFFYALSASDLRSLSLDGVENPDKKWNSKGAHKQKVEKYDNEGVSNSDQKYRSRVIFRQQKVVNEWKNPSIYNKILSQSRYWCIIKILLTKSRTNFYGISYYIFSREK